MVPSRRECGTTAIMVMWYHASAGQSHSARGRCLLQALCAAEPQENRKSFTTWIDEAALKELRDLSHETGRKQQELVAEALNMLFVKHGKRRGAR